MLREGGIGKGIRQRLEVVLQRFATCDNGETGTILRRFFCVQR